MVKAFKLPGCETENKVGDTDGEVECLEDDDLNEGEIEYVQSFTLN